MNHFIDSVVRYILGLFDDNLQDIEIIVPNNRTGSALLSSLKKNVNKVCWAPQITPIKDIFTKGSSIHETENVVLLYILFDIYKEFYSNADSTDSFDKFYSFGEVLLSDFDDIDKYLVEPEKLFNNKIAEEEINTKFGTDFDEELVSILNNFWKKVSMESLLNNKIKTLELWKNMPSIYNKYKERLTEKKVGYQGLIYRQFIEERLEHTKFALNNYAFVGFSALNKCEKELFRHIRKLTKEREGKCLFFWDADEYYIKNKEQEAGLFLSNDIKEFPLPEGFELSNSIKDLYSRDIQTIEVPTSIAQVKLVPKLIEQYQNINGNTAIILGDEKLLVPLIYSLPEGLEYNITMGYPLSYTGAASFVQNIMKLAMHRSKRSSQQSTHFIRKDIFSAIMHSFSRAFIPKESIDKINDIIRKSKIDYININLIQESIDQNEMLKIMFDVDTMEESFPKYVVETCKFVYKNVLEKYPKANELEFMHKIITLFTSFRNAIGDNKIFENDKMYYKLMTSMIKQSNMTFDGKSDDKLQILGFMETRCIDFENIIMLSMNEDTFPKSSYKDSMIPYNLRKAFSMPSIEYQNSIFAYYFYRLLQRSKNIRILYSSEGKISKIEKSRFITQIEYELMNLEDNISNNPKYHTTKSYIVKASKPKAISITKTDATLTTIQKLLGCEKDGGAYPILINTYISCPLKFYFKYIEKLKEYKGIDEDTTNLDLGNLLHKSCYYLYKDYISTPKNVIEIDSKKIEEIKAKSEYAINQAIKEVFEINENDQDLYETKSKIIIKPIEKYLHKIIENDKKYAPFEIIDLENYMIQSNSKTDYCIEYKVGDKNVQLKGIIDRIDKKGNTIRVIDYKTSSIQNNSKCYDSEFWSPEVFHSAEAAQVLIYSEIMSNQYPDYDITPCLISVTNLDDYMLKYKTQKGERSSYTSIDSYKQTILINNEECNLRDDVNSHLQQILAEILDKNTNFNQTENADNCKYCPYKGICNKN